MEAEFVADLFNGKILIFEDYVEIHHDKWQKMKTNMEMKKNLRIPISDIQHVQIFKPFLTSGYIRISTDGTLHQKKQPYRATQEDNCVMVRNRKQYRLIEEVKKRIEEKMGIKKEPSPSNPYAID